MWKNDKPVRMVIVSMQDSLQVRISIQHSYWLKPLTSFLHSMLSLNKQGVDTI